MSDSPILHVRTVFLSDVHLGTRGCQAELLLDFIRSVDCAELYLIGDIVDGWRLKRGWFWPQTHNDVVQKWLRLARKGVKVTYVPGNHDAFARDFCGARFGGVEVRPEAVHTAADGRRYLIIHGDAYDGVVQHGRWVALFGDLAYVALIKLNTGANLVRRRLGFGYWSLAAFLKGKVRNALTYIDRFEHAAAEDARSRGLDGVVCGHIHRAGLRDIDGIAYANDGDWVESCTALVEHLDGRLELIDWAKLRGAALAPKPRGRVFLPTPEPEPAPA